MSIFGKKKAEFTAPSGLTSSGSFPLYNFSFTGARPETPKPTTPLPVRKSTQPIRAWREWKLLVRNGEPFIRSLTREDVWEGPILRSDQRPADYTTPGNSGETGHGIYAYPVTHILGHAHGIFLGLSQMMGAITYGAMPSQPANEGGIEGEVELMGRVVRHERGYRAEVARVVRLFVKELAPSFDRNVIIAGLADRYQCEVAWLPTFTPPAEVVAPKDDTKKISKRMKRAGLAVPTPEEYTAIMRGQRGSR